MNNYTIVIHARQAGITADQVKAAVEDILVRALPPVTLKFGEVSQPDADTILVLVSSDGKRDFLASRLRGLESRLPVRLERIEWGNQAAAQAGTVQGGMHLFPTFNYLRTDPYASAAPQSKPVYAYRPSIWSNLRGAFSTVFLLLWVILLILYLATSGRVYPSFLESSLAGWGMQLWLLLSILAGPPYAPWHMITSITCDLDGIEVRYFLNPRRKRRAWTEIHGMNVNTLELALLSKQKPVRFSAKQQTGFKEEPMLIKTIIARADLRFAGASLANFTYRRADAPD